ncbi:MAG TPA: glycine cleavage system protein GcvH [Phycisphaerae bacterium]
MPVANDRKYLDTHEWFKVERDLVTIGITPFAANELTDITFVSLPPIGKQVTAGKAFGEIESVKATSELFTALGGEVVAVNNELTAHPEWVNEDALGKGWMIKLRSPDLSPLGKLMDGPAYDKFTGGK